jgi:hypothetical protein
MRKWLLWCCGWWKKDRRGAVQGMAGEGTRRPVRIRQAPACAMRKRVPGSSASTRPCPPRWARAAEAVVVFLGLELGTQANYLALDHQLPRVLECMQRDPYGVGHPSESGPAARVGSELSNRDGSCMVDEVAGQLRRPAAAGLLVFAYTCHVLV